MEMDSELVKKYYLARMVKEKCYQERMVKEKCYLVVKQFQVMALELGLAEELALELALELAEELAEELGQQYRLKFA